MLAVMTQKKLQIYSPRNSFEMDRYLLKALILWSLPFLFNFTKSIFTTYEEDLDLLSVFFVIIAFLYSLYFFTSNFFKCETTNGEFNGYQVIDSEKITCNLDVCTIYEIEKIGILSDYFRGKFNGNIRAWQRKKSNGVKNYIEIYKKERNYKDYFLDYEKTKIDCDKRNKNGENIEIVIFQKTIKLDDSGKSL